MCDSLTPLRFWSRLSPATPLPGRFRTARHGRLPVAPAGAGGQLLGTPGPGVWLDALDRAFAWVAIEI